MKTNRLVIALSICAAALVAASPSSASTIVTTPNGQWTAYPGQSTTYQTAVQQPVNADGSSNFKSNGKAVIPIKLKLSQGTGAFVFQSIFSDNTTDPTTTVTANDYSYLNWTPRSAITFADITSLVANYAFSHGNCQGGSLRWTVRLNDNGTNRNLDIHYQPGANSLSEQTCASGTSGVDLTDSTDTIYVTQAFNHLPYTFPTGYANTYADALSQLGSLPVIGMTLIVDSGWGAHGDQVVDLSSATVGVGGSAGYTETFTPQAASAPAATCPTAPASVQIVKVTNGTTGDVNEPVTIQAQDNDSMFRIVDCMYMYNLATSSLYGPGHYEVTAVINGVPASGPAVFDLR
jgi:hypothetical protein